MKLEEIQLDKAVIFNPKINIKKNIKYKRITMEMLKEHYKFINQFEYDYFNGGSKFEQNDTLLAKITPCLENGKTAYVDFLRENEVAFGSTEFITIRNNNKTDRDYIYYLFTSDLIRKKAIKCLEGTSGRKRINEYALKKQIILLPELDTQKKISQFLSLLDKKISINNELNKITIKFLKNYFIKTFITFQNENSNLAYNDKLNLEIPNDWEAKTLDNIVEIKTEIIDPQEEEGRIFKLLSIPSYDEDGSFRKTQGKNINSNKLVITENNLLLSKLNPKFNRIYYPTDCNDLLASTEFFNFSCKDLFMKNFLYILFQTDHFINYCSKSATGTSNSHKRIKKDVLMNFKTPFNEDAIKNFGNLINPFVQKINLRNDEIRSYNSFKKFMHQLFLKNQIVIN